MATQNITLPVWNKSPIPVRAVQGEADSRVIAAALMDSAGQPVDLTGASVRLYVHKPDGKTVFMDGAIMDAAGGVCSFTLRAQVTAVPGQAACEILATWPNSQALKAVGLTLDILLSNLEGAVESSDDFSALVVALNAVSDTLSAATKAVSDCTTATAGANTAAAGANSAASGANAAASAANSAGAKADSAAQSANLAASAANTSKAGADSAAQRANDAASAANASKSACDVATQSASSAASNANSKANAADTAANAAISSAQSADSAARSANQAAADAAEKYRMINPLTGQEDYITNILAGLSDYIFRDSITAQEFDDLDITAEAFDNLDISAVDFDTRAKAILGGA